MLSGRVLLAEVTERWKPPEKRSISRKSNPLPKIEDKNGGEIPSELKLHSPKFQRRRGNPHAREPRKGKGKRGTRRSQANAASTTLRTACFSERPKGRSSSSTTRRAIRIGSSLCRNCADSSSFRSVGWDPNSIMWRSPTPVCFIPPQRCTSSSSPLPTVSVALFAAIILLSLSLYHH